MVLNGTLILAQILVGVTPVGVCRGNRGVRRAESHGLVEVLDGALGLTQTPIGYAAIVAPLPRKRTRRNIYFPCGFS